MDTITQLFVDYKNEHRVTDDDEKAKNDSGTMKLEISDKAIGAISLASLLFTSAICLGVCCCVRQIQKLNEKVKLAQMGRQGLEFQNTGRSGDARQQSTNRHIQRLETDAPMTPGEALDTEANMEEMKEDGEK